MSARFIGMQPRLTRRIVLRPDRSPATWLSGGMAQLKIRQTSADLPDVLDEAQIAQVDTLAGQGKLISRFELAKVSVRAFDIEDTHLLDGRVRSVRADSAEIRRPTIRSVEFTRCDIGALRWSGGVISRTRFDGCKLLAARFANVTLDHVVFSDCRLDYAALSQIRAKGPVLFVRCSLREAEFRGCDLSRALFDECDLTLTEFAEGNYRGCDLRGNDLSATRGAHHLRRVLIDRAQVLQLAEALATDLEVTFGDERRGSS
jgi:uncharacterized protein YjbI with pentapeptide repeats